MVITIDSVLLKQVEKLLNVIPGVITFCVIRRKKDLILFY